MSDDNTDSSQDTFELAGPKRKKLTGKLIIVNVIVFAC